MTEVFILSGIVVVFSFIIAFFIFFKTKETFVGETPIVLDSMKDKKYEELKDSPHKLLDKEDSNDWRVVALSQGGIIPQYTDLQKINLQGNFKVSN